MDAVILMGQATGCSEIHPKRALDGDPFEASIRKVGRGQSQMLNVWNVGSLHLPSGKYLTITPVS